MSPRKSRAQVTTYWFWFSKTNFESFKFYFGYSYFIISFYKRKTKFLDSTRHWQYFSTKYIGSIGWSKYLTITILRNGKWTCPNMSYWVVVSCRLEITYFAKYKYIISSFWRLCRGYKNFRDSKGLSPSHFFFQKPATTKKHDPVPYKHETCLDSKLILFFIITIIIL